MLIKELFDRQNLEEGRNEGLSYTFARKNKKNNLETLLPLSACKDYINDFIFVENTQRKLRLIYGLQYQYSGILNSTDPLYLVVGVLPNFSADFHNPLSGFNQSQRYITHIKKTNDFINHHKNILEIFNSFIDKFEITTDKCIFNSSIKTSIYDTSEFSPYYGSILTINLKIPKELVQNPILFGAVSWYAREYYTKASNWDEILTAMDDAVVNEKSTPDRLNHYFLTLDTDIQKQLLFGYDFTDYFSGKTSVTSNYDVHNQGMNYYFNAYINNKGIDLDKWEQTYPAYVKRNNKRNKKELVEI